MPPRRDAVRVVQHRADDEEEEDDASSADDEEEGEEEDEEEEEAVPAGPGATGVRARERTEGCPLVPAGGPAPKKIKLVGGLAAARAAGGCKACGSMNHAAGFVGSVYVDCPDKPCYLCKKVGHTTATCPHRAAVAGTAGGGGGGGGGEGAPRARRALATPLRLAWRETGGCVAGAPEGCGGGCGSPAAPYAPPRDWRVCSAVTRLHARRVTALAWHPTRRSLLVSGDKRGQVAFWDHESMEKAVLPSGAAHHWLVTAVRFLDGDPDTAYTSGVDGRVSATNCETHAVQRVGTLNPGMAWTEDENKLWRSATAMEALQGAGALLVGDDVGRVTLLDPRTGRMGASFQAAKARQKVATVAATPHEPRLFAVGGNDHCVRLWDVRKLPAPGDGAGGGSGAASSSAKADNRALSLALATLPHPRVVSDIAFSPLTGRRLMTTCPDNRVRVWDRVSALGGAEVAPSREVIHSQDFNRHLSPFRAVWDPKDATESTFVVGRYISEDFGGVALHPIDVFSAASGALLVALRDPNVQTIQPVVAVHASEQLIAAGTSTNLVVYEPTPPDDDGDAAAVAEAADAAGAAAAAALRRQQQRAAFKPRTLHAGGKGGKGGRDDDDDEDDDDAPKKKGKGKGKGKAV